ncbi:MAG TPA: hypothetical protein PLZ36_05665 [Armatimonadota bacterium]|nr:hypothetical protein [Armatimonadota bacterium]HOS43173.1 hypothetical protein [Armatimonadota bacterium]
MQRVMMEVHPIEANFLRQVRRWRFGIVKEIKIEDGLPMLAEFVHERVRFDKAAEER